MGYKFSGCRRTGRSFVGVDMAQPLSDATRELGERVRARRHKLGLSQEAFADTAGLHWTFVGQVERGQRNLSLHNLLKLADALGVDAGTLVKGLSPPTQISPPMET